MWQITEDRLADITLTTGESYEYEITDDQLEQLRRKMRDGVGSVELVPNFGSKLDEPEILNVRAIARVKPLRRKNYSLVLVQLWGNPDTGRIYIVDPDDTGNAWCVDVARGTDVERRDFGMEAYCLVEGDASLSDIGVPVGRPPADEVVWELLAEYHGEHRGVTVEAAAGPYGNAQSYLSQSLEKVPA